MTVQGVSAEEVGSFGGYAEYYDFLYATKDYELECGLIVEALRRHSQVQIESLLDVGCGTAGHLIPLARQGWRLRGIDKSDVMLRIGASKLETAGLPITLTLADARSFDLGEVFDAITCMFAAFGYVTENADSLSTLRRMRHHVRRGGVLVMDVWYGPAVLTLRPEKRVLHRKRSGLDVIRAVTPTLDSLRHTVTTDYEIWALRDRQLVDHISETHVMRFFFPQELSHYLEEAGFELLTLTAFPTLDDQVTEHDWNAVVVARAT